MEERTSPLDFPPSPVPSDKELSPGELPFTAFGQFGKGKMDNRVFDQDIYWVDINGAPYHLDEMPEDYLRNVIGFLHDNAEYFHAFMSLRVGIEALADSFRGKINAEVLFQELGIPTIGEISPEEWLESTPLMRKLRSLT